MKSYENLLSLNKGVLDVQVVDAVDRMAQRPEPVDDAWHRQALCIELDPELFDDTVKSDPRIELARQACGACLVTDQCKEFAFANPDYYEIYAGLTGDQRRIIVRKRSRVNRRRNR